MKATACNLCVMAALILPAAGCASVKPPAGRDAFNDYVPYKDIGAKPGTPDNPDTGWNSLIVAVLQAAFSR